jgi:ABC-type transport system involved in multi-copper enzyme maturation permease subunit
VILAILSKDISLLRVYIRSSIVVTAGCYLLAIALTLWLTSFHEQTMQTLVQRTFLALSVGSRFGFIATGLLGALLAGSAVTLERSDRSVEFLACLPPTRWHNLTSKLVVVCSVVLSMVAIHFMTTMLAYQLIPYVRVDTRIQVPDANTIATFFCLIVSTVGGAWGFASCMKSNGAPIVLGMATPFLTLTLVLLIGKLLNVSSEGDSFQLRYNTGSVILGFTLGLIGSYLYLTRREP